MKKLLITIAALAIGLSLNAASYHWGLQSYEYLGPDGSGYDSDLGGNFYSGGTAFLYLGTVAYDNGFVTDGTTYLGYAGYNEDIFGYGTDNADVTTLPSNADVDAAGGQTYSIVFVDANVTSLDDPNIENYIIVTGTSENGFDPGTETSYAQMVNYDATPGSGSYAWAPAAEPVPEPTSGLLLLLGMAGLALKRKRA